MSFSRKVASYYSLESQISNLALDSDFEFGLVLVAQFCVKRNNKEVEVEYRSQIVRVQITRHNQPLFVAESFTRGAEVKVKLMLETCIYEEARPMKGKREISWILTSRYSWPKQEHEQEENPFCFASPIEFQSILAHKKFCSLPIGYLNFIIPLNGNRILNIVALF